MPGYTRCGAVGQMELGKQKGGKVQNEKEI